MTYTLKVRILDALDAQDMSYVHVLLHVLAQIYGDTPFQDKFPTLYACYLEECSQAGREEIAARGDSPAAR
jgi:hypothetical protein